MAETVTIASRFRGPPASANGGYVCGVVGERVHAAGAAVEATLRKPPPLDTPLAVEIEGPRVRVRAGDVVIAEAVPAPLELAVPEPVGFEAAGEAARGYLGFERHPFPTCFVCGPEREAGDGLRIFPGAVTGRDVAASPWIPDPSLAGDDGLVRPEIVWAVLDCPSWFGFAAFESFEGAAVLGRLTARLEGRPRPGDRCVAMGWLVGRDGRKIHTASALHTEDGRLLGVARATWIALA
jgi:hypothetical protein